MTSRQGSVPRPRIHWVSPLPPARTDIAEYTRRLLPALTARADVVLWTDAGTVEPAVAAMAPVRRFDPGRPVPFDGRGGDGRQPEALFLHVGNAWAFHGGIIAAARRCAGIVVLHDLSLFECLLDLVRHGRLAPDALRAAALVAGGDAPADTETLLAGRRPAAPPPLFDAVLTRAVAVLTHTRQAAETVASRGRLPVYRLDLPYPAGPAPRIGRAGTGPLRLVQFGHIGPNRRLDAVLAGLGQIRDDIDFVFDIYGAVWDPAHIRTVARRCGVADRVHLHGFVPEPQLDAALAEAHAVFNLRQPTMHEASGSQLRIWNAGAVALVTDLGWYAGLPDDTAIKLDPVDEAGGVAGALRRIAHDRALCARIGRAGRHQLEAHHDPETYAEGVVAIVNAAGRDARERLIADALTGLLADSPAPALLRTRLGERLG
jgi:glycosyltransferase involved in cell wall biosynthesis